MDVLQIKNLTKRFGNKEVLCGLDLSVPEHSVFGFIGRNGAGKTGTFWKFTYEPAYRIFAGCTGILSIYDTS